MLNFMKEFVWTVLYADLEQPLLDSCKLCPEASAPAEVVGSAAHDFALSRRAVRPGPVTFYSSSSPSHTLSPTNLLPVTVALVQGKPIFSLPSTQRASRNPLNILVNRSAIRRNIRIVISPCVQFYRLHVFIIFQFGTGVYVPIEVNHVTFLGKFLLFFCELNTFRSQPQRIGIIRKQVHN